ncbi:MAG: NAD-dependent epimerase/dehydratase family protein [Solirubrobacteraceae bacterium]
MSDVIEPSRRICLVGAGNVARVHAKAIAQIPGIEIAAVCDLEERRARDLAEELDVEQVFSSVAEAGDSGVFDYAHVLVPPDLHLSVAQELAAANVGVLLEKPMGIDSSECLAFSRKARVQVGVNHNAVFFPVYLRLRKHLAANTVGALQHLMIVLSVPSHALPGPQHWALAQPQNLMYESAAHPLSQIFDLAGPMVSAQTAASGRQRVGHGHYFDTWQVSLECERATAQLFLSYGGSYRTWELIALCDDGLIGTEIEQNRFGLVSRTRWGSTYESLHVALTSGVHEVGQGLGAIGEAARAVAQPAVGHGPYFKSMQASVAAFHAGPLDGMPLVDGAFGAGVVAMCEAITKDFAVAQRPKVPRPTAPSRDCDVLVLGGTGFIGRSVVGRLLETDAQVRVMARSLPLLEPGEPLADAEFVAGDITDADAVNRAIKGARTVIHLAHGGRFGWDEVTTSMIEPAKLVASLCLEYAVERLVYTGTIASLYLGDPLETITGATPTDPRARERGPYEWGKAESEAVLLHYHREEGLAVTILRPGVVLGRGGTPFHSGFGDWRGVVHCVGWNAGRNPLPLVLVSDVAAAILLAGEPDTPVGRAFNVVGDVRLTARECVAILRDVLRRPLVFHPRHPLQNQALKSLKWTIRAATGNRLAPFPSYRGVKSMGCDARFDCTDLARDLGWVAIKDRERFISQALRIHA